MKKEEDTGSLLQTESLCPLLVYNRPIRLAAIELWCSIMDYITKKTFWLGYIRQSMDYITS